MAKDKGSGPVLTVGIDATGAEAGARKAEAALNKLGKTATKTSQKFTKTEVTVNKAQKSLRQLASSIAVVDGPLGGVASRFNALGTLLGRVTPQMVGFAVATVALSAAIRTATKIFIPYEQTILRLNAVLKATGRQSEITAEQIDAFATELGIATLTNRTAVIEATATLAAFGNVGSESFERVLIAAQDLSAVFGGNLKTNTILLGRALQSPAEAFTVLERRVGRFTQAEKDLLKALVDSGRAATAQEVIFSKLAVVQGAGRAEAQGLAGDFDTLGENATALALKFNETFKISRFLDIILRVLSSALSGLTNIFSNLLPSIDSVVNAFDALGVAIQTFGGGILAKPLTQAQAELVALEAAIRKDERAQRASNKAKEDATNKTDDATEAARNQAKALKESSKFLDNLIQQTRTFEREGERRRNAAEGQGSITDDAVKLREEIEKLSNIKDFELRAFGLENANEELLKLQDLINMDAEAFRELGNEGQIAFDKIQADIIQLEALQDQQDLTKPIDDYLKAAEFNLKKVNEIIIRSGETALDALVDPYKAGETAAERWKAVVANILRDVAKEIIRTQIIARAIGFVGALAGGAFSGPTAPRGTGGVPLPVPRPSALGNVFNNGKIIPHANGGVVSSFSAFPMAGGNTGTIAEGNRPEAILPLRRNSSGQLGVISSGGGGTNITVNNNVVVNSNGGNSKEQDENLGRAIAKQIDTKINQSISKILLKERKPGGSFNSGAFA